MTPWREGGESTEMERLVTITFLWGEGGISISLWEGVCFHLRFEKSVQASPGNSRKGTCRG